MQSQCQLSKTRLEASHLAPPRCDPTKSFLSEKPQVRSSVSWSEGDRIGILSAKQLADLYELFAKQVKNIIQTD